jgi:hypothetical protein
VTQYRAVYLTICRGREQLAKHPELHYEFHYFRGDDEELLKRVVLRVTTPRWLRAAADGHSRFFLCASQTGVVDSVPAEAMNSTVEASQLGLDELLYASLPAAVVRAGV